MTNHLRPSWILLALIILAVPNTGAIAAESTPLMNYLQNPNPEQWPQVCAKVKRKLSKSPAAFLTFTPLPKLSHDVAKVWKLNWHGLTIPVPPAQYSKIALFDMSGIFNILALSTNNYRQSFSTMTGLHNLPDHSLQQSSSDRGTSIKMPGGQVNLVEFLMRAYATTPKSLTCSMKNVTQQVLDVTALQSKLPQPGSAHLPAALKKYGLDVQITAIHKLEGSSVGILEQASTSSNDAKYSYFLHQGSSLRLYTVQYKISKSRPELLRAALLLAKPNAAVYTDAPAWFQRLQIWLDKPAQPHWCNLLSALKQAHFDPKDVRNLAKQHPACQAPQP